MKLIKFNNKYLNKIPKDVIFKLNQKKLIIWCRTNVINGGYITEICLNCGAVFTNPNKKTENFKFIKKCPQCIFQKSKKKI